jgi:hypothetical protein
MSATLFVTALIDLGTVAPELKSVETRLAHFRTLAQTGIPLCVFTSSAYATALQDVCRECPNVHLHRCIELQETPTYRMCEAHKDSLPAMRNVVKDTAEFLTLMNAKLDFMDEAAQAHDARQLAWIDFNVWHVVRNTEQVAANLQRIAASELDTEQVCIPGCWPAGPVARERISWRFCGGFFLGKKEAIARFVEAYRKQAHAIFAAQGLTWEVNVWAILEQSDAFAPCWYKADHNDTLFQIPDNCFTSDILHSP